MKIALGNDHAGFALKRQVHEFLESLGHEVLDRGTADEKPVDFPDVVWATCAELRQGNADRAVLVCGTGVGAVMAANKIVGIRCALAHDVYSAHQSVEHDDANVIALGSWIVGRALACEAIAAFLAASFDADEDTLRRVRKLGDLEVRAARELGSRGR